jgi:hypothetical protein
MATVHTAYGPGEVVDQETIRGRTQYKVAGDGFEVWLDETKLGGYTPPSEVDFSAPHWSGYEPGEKITPDAFGPGEHVPISDEEYAEMVDPRGRFDRNRMRTHEDYDGYDERLAWAPMDHGNSTTLPYNPKPQHDAIGSPGDDGTATIQPIHHIDPEERLHSSDSLTFDDEGDDYGDGPGPSEELFAKSASPSLLLYHPMVRKLVDKHVPDNLRKFVEPAFGAGQAQNVNKGVQMLDGQVSQVVDAVSPGAGWGDLIKKGDRHEALLPAILPAVAGAAARAAGGAAARGLAGGAGRALADATDEAGPGEGWGDLVKDSSYRPAGLSDRYIDLTASVDYWNDPVAQFRHDPDAYINRIGHIMDEGLNPRFAEYMELVDGDRSIRTAAWKDVRKKALRLKREGHVTVKDMSPGSIMASVVGDHGTYDVAILKGATINGITGSSIANWHCACEWGRWAFRRKYTYVGRLCSHAYASYLTMQSAAMKGKERPRRPGPTDAIIVNRPARDRQLPTFTYAAGRRTADALQNGPERLTPDMVVNDTDDAHIFLDVTKDERDDTGPDDVVSEKDIVHFARVMAECERTEQPYPRQLVAFLARYAGCNDDYSDDTQADYKAHDADDANEYLEKIRSEGDRKQEEDFGSMAERVHRIQDTVEEARAHGADASQFVAAVRRLAAPIAGNPVSEDAPFVPGYPGDVEGETVGGEAFSWFPRKGDGVGRTVMKDGVPYTQNGRSLEKYVPKTTETSSDAAADIAADNEDDYRDSGSSIPAERAKNNQPYKPGDAAANKPVVKGPAATPETAKPGTAAPAANAPGSATGEPAPAGGGPTKYTAPGGGQTTGDVADGGVAGAENSNNAAITKADLDANGNYIMKPGDTLTDVAQRSTGDMNKYQDIAKANSGITNVDDIATGTAVNLKDFVNDVGNAGVPGQTTNPAGGGSDKNMATPDAGPAATTDAITSAPPPQAQSPGATAPGDTSGVGTGTGAGVPGADSAAKPITPAAALRRRAAPADPNADPNAAASTTTSTPTPGAATTPPTPASTTAPAPGVAATPAAGTPGTGVNQPKTVGPSESGDTYDPDDPSQVQQQQGTGADRNGGGQAENPAMDMGMDALSGIGDIASGIGSALPDLAQGAMQAAPAIASGVGNAVSGLMSGLGGILGAASSSSSLFSSRQDFDDWVRYAYPAGGGDDFDPKTLPHIPFAGSGNPGPLEIGTSEEYADRARAKADDVTDLGDDPLSTPMGDWQKQGGRDEHEWWNDPSHPMYVHPRDRAKSVDELIDPGYSDYHDDVRGKPWKGDWQGQMAPGDDGDHGNYMKSGSLDDTDDSSDIVRAFQANLNDTALGAGGGGGGRFDDFSSAAQGFLRTAGRNYSLAEQSELIREGDKGGAGNLRSLDLAGTHYEDMHTLGW